MGYVIFQFLMLSVLLLHISYKQVGIPSIILFVIAFLLGVWAIFTMGPPHVSVIPHVGNKTKLTFKGPYKYVRHPMYSALLIFALAVVLHNPIWQVFGAATVLLFTLILKLKFEERQLLENFATYSAYKQKTKALFPFLF